MKNISFVALLLAFVFLSCGSEEGQNKSENNNSIPQSQAEIDDAKLKNYLEENNIEAESTKTGLYYVIENPGEGDPPKLSNTVVMHYKGSLLDGTVFESSYDSGKPLRYQLGALIEGWRQGVPMLGKGGKATFFIPSGLAYGPRGAGPQIGPNTPLIFEVELLDYQ
jgi:FKBP-type peptidyl-prolyl cis-trans isomerase